MFFPRPGKFFRAFVTMFDDGGPNLVRISSIRNLWGSSDGRAVRGLAVPAEEKIFSLFRPRLGALFRGAAQPAGKTSAAPPGDRKWAFNHENGGKDGDPTSRGEWGAIIGPKLSCFPEIFSSLDFVGSPHSKFLPPGVSRLPNGTIVERVFFVPRFYCPPHGNQVFNFPFFFCLPQPFPSQGPVGPRRARLLPVFFFPPPNLRPRVGTLRKLLQFFSFLAGGARGWKQSRSRRGQSGFSFPKIAHAAVPGGGAPHLFGGAIGPLAGAKPRRRGPESGPGPVAGNFQSRTISSKLKKKQALGYTLFLGDDGPGFFFWDGV